MVQYEKEIWIQMRAAEKQDLIQIVKNEQQERINTMDNEKQLPINIYVLDNPAGYPLGGACPRHKLDSINTSTDFYTVVLD